MRAARIHAISQWGPFTPCRTSYCRILVHHYHYPLRYIVKERNRGRNMTFCSFLLKYNGRKYTHFRETWKRGVEICSNLHRVSTLPGAFVAQGEYTYCQNWWRWHSKISIMFWFFSLYQGNGWHILDSVVLTIMVKTMFFKFLVGVNTGKRHILGLLSNASYVILTDKGKTEHFLTTAKHNKARTVNIITVM